MIWAAVIWALIAFVFRAFGATLHWEDQLAVNYAACLAEAKGITWPDAIRAILDALEQGLQTIEEVREAYLTHCL